MIFGMPPSFVFAILFGLVALGFVVAGLVNRDARAVRLLTAGALVVIAFALGMNASANLVPSQHTGIVVEFKAATGSETDKGLVWVRPWQTVSSWDNSRQTYDHLNEKTCVTVRISGSQTACVEVKIEWRALPGQSAEQWASYREHEFGVFRDRRVNPALTDAVNEAFETHDPLSNVDKETGAINPPPKGPIVQRIKDGVKTRIGSDVDVPDLRVTIGFIRYNDEVQRQLEEYSKKVLELRVLKQEETNAETRKRITDKNTQRDPRAWCLEISERNANSEPGLCMSGAGVTPVLPVK